MNNMMGLAIESLVAVLLLLTILYCARLNARIKLLRADERAMKSTIAELVLATENAERAIGGLKLTVREAQDTLEGQLRDAEDFNSAMAEHLRAGEDVLDRLRKIAQAGRLMGATGPAPGAGPDVESAPADTRAIAAAAKALAERTRAHVNGPVNGLAA